MMIRYGWKHALPVSQHRASDTSWACCSGILFISFNYYLTECCNLQGNSRSAAIKYVASAKYGLTEERYIGAHICIFPIWSIVKIVIICNFAATGCLIMACLQTYLSTCCPAWSLTCCKLFLVFTMRSWKVLTDFLRLKAASAIQM